jgi:hypothetical protein
VIIIKTASSKDDYEPRIEWPIDEEITPVVPEDSVRFVYINLGRGDCIDTGETAIGSTDRGIECIENCVEREYYWSNWSTDGGSCYCENMSYTDECSNSGSSSSSYEIWRAKPEESIDAPNS